MNVLIVDDEQLARQRLRHMLSGMGERVVGEAETGEQALLQSQHMHPDIVLMDIRMPGMDGLEAASYINQLDDPPAIIFTTAYSDHALQAFETHAVDYLLKPIKQERLASAMSAARRLTRAQIDKLREKGEGANARSKICVKSRGALELVPVDDIIYFKADQKYVTLRTEDHEYLIEESLKTLEDEFGQRYIRIHRNALVSTRHIAGLEKNTGGHACIVLRDIDDQLEISRRHLPSIRKMLKNPSC